VGTTKLTRKEILSDDFVHEGIIRLFELFRINRAKIAVAAIVIVVLFIGLWAGSHYLDGRALAASERLGTGIAFFQASVSADAADDPYAKGGAPVFKSDEAKYQAAATEFTAAADAFGAGETGKTARYFLGLTQFKLDKKDEAVKTLEKVAFGSGSHTVGFLAKKALASHYAESGNAKGAVDLLQGMLKDSKCDLPKEELSLQLSRVLVADGKKDEAVKVLREASEQAETLGAFGGQLLAEIEKLQK
jgi:predicted negative regulator of RcsB-dependent stress response